MACVPIIRCPKVSLPSMLKPADTPFVFTPLDTSTAMTGSNLLSSSTARTDCIFYPPVCVLHQRLVLRIQGQDTGRAHHTAQVALETTGQ